MEELKHLHMLSEQIGPRGAATSSEELAAHYIKEEMKKNKIVTEVQSFSTTKSHSWIYAFICFIFLMAFALFSTSHLLAFTICFLGLFFFKKELEATGALNKIFARRKSQNVLGKVPASKYPVKKVVFTSHYDSSRSGLSFNPEVVKNFRTAFLVTYYSMAIMCILYGSAVIFTILNFPIVSILAWLLSLPPALVLLVSFIVILYQEFFGEDTPGANDNASGVSVLMELSKEIKDNPPDFVETWFLFTGAKEAGTLGIVNFLEQYKPDPQNTFIINLDSIGIGNVKYILEEGMLKKYSSNDKLVKWATLAIQEKPSLKVKGDYYFDFTTDATAALARNYKAISIMAMDEEGFIPNWHWPTDTINRIERGNLTLSRTLAKRMLYKINDDI